MLGSGCELVDEIDEISVGTRVMLSRDVEVSETDVEWLLLVVDFGEFCTCTCTSDAKFNVTGEDGSSSFSKGVGDCESWLLKVSFRGTSQITNDVLLLVTYYGIDNSEVF